MRLICLIYDQSYLKFNITINRVGVSKNVSFNQFVLLHQKFKFPEQYGKSTKASKFPVDVEKAGNVRLEDTSDD